MRILDAVLSHIEHAGLRKVTMDDIARRAGLARVTLYSYFPNKQAIVSAALAREVEAFFADLDEVAGRIDDPEERLVETFAHAYRTLRAHRLLERVMASEPEIVFPFIAGEAPVFLLARDWVAAKLVGAPAGLIGARTPVEAAELIVRLIQSLVFVPPTAFGLGRPRGPQDFARGVVLPAIRGQAD
ncbi:MAG: hypothetical protein NVS1B9_13890 [Solirubrobacteraceae bacterium]